MASSPAKGSPGLESRPRGKHSGRLLLRMPKELHGELAQAAAQDGVSLNQFISSTLARAVGWAEGQAAPEEPDSNMTAARVSRSSHAPRAVPPEESRSGLFTGNRLMIALAANFVIVLVAAAIALGMLIAAWRG